FVGRAYAEGRPQVTADLAASGRSYRPDLDRASELRSFMAVPLRAGDRVLGVLAAGSLAAAAFDDRAQRMLERLGDHAAVALEHAELYRRAREEVAERERAEAALRASERSSRALFEAALAMSGATDLPARLARVLDSAIALLGADFAEVLL